MTLLIVVVTVSIFALATRVVPAERIISRRGLAMSKAFDRLLISLAELIIRRPRRALALSLAVLTVTLAGIPMIKVEQDQLKFFPEDAPVRLASELMDEHLAGSSIYTISIRTAEEGRLYEPSELRRIEALQTFLHNETGADTSVSFVDYVKLMMREFSSGTPADYRIPDTRQQVAQLALMAGDTTTEDYLDEAHRWARIEVRTSVHEASRLHAMFLKIEDYLAEKFPRAEGYVAHATGDTRLAGEMFRSIIDSQLASMAVSLTLIFAMLFVLFRSVSTGVYSILPNAFPILVVLGVMGWSGIELNIATVMVSTVALGIAVDDTIHFLQCYRESLRRQGSQETALRETFHIKGPAIVATSMVFTFGFGILVLSGFAASRHFGILAAAAMLAALFGDLVLLASMLLTSRTRLGVAERLNIKLEGTL